MGLNLFLLYKPLFYFNFIQVDNLTDYKLHPHRQKYTDKIIRIRFTPTQTDQNYYKLDLHRHKPSQNFTNLTHTNPNRPKYYKLDPHRLKGFPPWTCRKLGIPILT